MSALKVIISIMLLITSEMTLAASHRKRAQKSVKISQNIPVLKQGIIDFMLDTFKDKVSGRLMIEPGRIDKKLSLPACHRPLHYSLPYGNMLKARQTVKVQCLTESVDWTLHVPTQVKLMVNVVVADRSLARNEIVSEQSVTLTEHDIINYQNGFYQQPEAVTGKITTRPLKVGQIITSHHIDAPKIIQRGELVQITAKHQGLVVKMPGLALMDGVAGKRIQVRNTKTSRIVEGYVAGPGQVEIHM